MLTLLSTRFRSSDAHKRVLGSPRSGIKSWHGESGSILCVGVGRVNRIVRAIAGIRRTGIVECRYFGRRRRFCHGRGAKSS